MVSADSPPLGSATHGARGCRGNPANCACPEDEKAADKLLQQAENYLANGMKDMARAKLQENVKKYPTTAAGKKADQMLLKVFGI
jgi:TolA-binding protein